ncbi:MAG: NAD(P)-binding protein [Actinomycetota bacterium]
MSTPIETDYLVVGAGAAGMSIVDELLTNGDPDLDVVLVDRRHRPGGHWQDAYPFVRLHQPSVYYGVNSRKLGHDRIDTSGPNAGFYERASADEICDYYQRVLDERFLDSGRVTFLGMHDYRGRDGEDHLVVSQLSGRPTPIRVRRRLVDATYVESVIPSRHTPSFAIDPAARLLTPNQLVHYADGSDDFTIIGAGKTAMDTCVWLLEQGIEPDRIRWIRPRDGWFVDRTYTQPLDLAANMIGYQAAMMESAASAESGLDLALRMEERGMMFRLDPTVEPEVSRGATVSRYELDLLRSIERVVRQGNVQAIGADRIEMTAGELATGPDVVHVDCTAPGLANAKPQPIFAGDTIRVQMTTLGVSPWSAALLGFIETLDLPDDERNRLCPPIPRAGLVAGQLGALAIGLGIEPDRRANADLAGWNAAARLNPGRSVADHLDEPEVQQAMETIMTNFGPAVANATARTAAA